VRHNGPSDCSLNLAVGEVLTVVVNLLVNYLYIINVSWYLDKVPLAASDVTVGVTVLEYFLPLIPQTLEYLSLLRKEDSVWGLVLGLVPANVLIVTADSWDLCVSYDDGCMRTCTVQLFVLFSFSLLCHF
jgi:hypothetical protein